MEEMEKLQPVIQRQLTERQELQENNLKAQLGVEKQQQLTLVKAEHKRMAKEVVEKKKRLQKVTDAKNKQLAKGIGMSKAEIKAKQAETKQQLVEDMKALDDEHEKITTEQTLAEEEDIDMYQTRVVQQLKERQDEEREKLKRKQAKERFELRQEEIDAKRNLTNEHHEKLTAMLAKHQADQSAQLEKQHSDKLTLLQNQHKNCITMVENQRQELLAFLQKQLSGEPNATFQDKVETEISKVIQEKDAEDKKQQQEIAEILEQEQRDLKQAQFAAKQELEETKSADIEKLDALQASNVLEE